MLEAAFTKKLLKGKIVGMDATTVEASTAMKLILRRDTGDTCMLCLTKLAKEAGLEELIGPIVARRRRSCRRIGFECGDLVAGVLSV